MPRRGKKGYRGKIFPFSGQQLLTVTIASSTTSNVLKLDLNTFVRANSIMVAFKYYRFTRLNLEIMPQAVSAAVLFGVSYVPENITGTTGISLVQLSEVGNATLIVLGGHTSGGVGQTVSRRLIVPRRLLLAGGSGNGWWVTTVNTEDDFVAQGTMIFAVQTAPGSTVTINLMARYTCECKVDDVIAVADVIARGLRMIKGSDDDEKSVAKTQLVAGSEPASPQSVVFVHHGSGALPLGTFNPGLLVLGREEKDCLPP